MSEILKLSVAERILLVEAIWDTTPLEGDSDQYLSTNSPSNPKSSLKQFQLSPAGPGLQERRKYIKHGFDTVELEKLEPP